jgi:riboflavin kinase / FMN adenylyltransferase
MIVITGPYDPDQTSKTAAQRSQTQHAVIAIGNFDGVHKGHQALLQRAISRAHASGKLAGAMIFEPHPREYFVPTEPHFRLTPLPEKLRLFETMGLDVARVLTFDSRLANMSAQDFISRVLVDDLGISCAIVGYDFFFGHKRAGTPHLLTEAGKHYGFDVEIVAPVAELGEVFSSTSVRLKLAEGDFPGAAHALGRWWRITGTVVGGAKRGTGMGYPTANVPMPKGTALAHGIFAVRVEIDGALHDGAAYLGTRPTFDDGMPVLEVFLFDFDGDLYGQTIAVEFIAFLRGDRKFDSMSALVDQMTLDVAQARETLAKMTHLLKPEL